MEAPWWERLTGGKGLVLMGHAQYSSVQFSCSVVSNSLRPHELQHARLPCPSPTPGTCSNSYPLSQWCYPTISSPVVPFSSCLQSFPESGSFPMSQFFASDGQSIGVSVSVIPMNIQDWFPFRIHWFDLLVVQGTFKSLLRHYSSKASVLWPSAFFIVQLSHLYVTIGKAIPLTVWTCVSKVMFLLFKLLIFINFLLLIFASSFMKYHYKLMDFVYT